MVVAMVAGAGACGDPRAAEREKERQIEEALRSIQRDFDRGEAAHTRSDRDIQIPDDPSPRHTTPAPKSGCLASDSELTVFVKAGELRACVDGDQDGTLDACARWQRGSGKLVGVEPVFNVEATPDAPAFHTDSDDDERITQTDNSVEICPPDRACLKLMPALPDGQTIDEVTTDVAYRNAAVMISGSEPGTAHIDLWDLQTLRLRAKLPRSTPRRS